MAPPTPTIPASRLGLILKIAQLAVVLLVVSVVVVAFAFGKGLPNDVLMWVVGIGAWLGLPSASELGRMVRPGG